MRVPDQATASSLVQWAPPGGVISVYLEIDPADRAEGWRIELRNRLAEITDTDGAARAGGRGALGVQETVQALREGRVEHLLIDPDREWHSVEALVEPDGAPTVAAHAVELALTTRAKVTPVEGKAAEALAGDGGIAAILRY